MATDFVEPKKDSPDKGVKITNFEIDETGQVNEQFQRNDSNVEVSSRTSKSLFKSNHCCARCCNALWGPCLVKNNPLPEEPNNCQLLKYALMLPPHGRVGTVLTLVLATICVWGVIWSITGPEALPGGNLFGLTILLVAAVIGGEFVAKFNLPPLLGMLIVGGILKNVPKINVAEEIDQKWSMSLKGIALVVILTRAGIGLDPVKLRKLSFGVFRLAFSPCLVETISAVVCSRLLFDFPWSWGFMLGFVLAAVSPAVVVPSMLVLSERGYGVDKGIPTLIIAASSLDDVLAISGFGIALGVAFTSGNVFMMIVKGPLEGILGVAYGVVFGVICWYIPHKEHRNRSLFQFVILMFGGLFAQFGSRVADLSGAGAIGCLSFSFVAAVGWRREIPAGKELPLCKSLANMWALIQPLLFGLIGAEVDFSNIQLKTIGLGVLLLFIGLFLRMITSFLAVCRLGLNLHEKLFVPLAWMPKATVQAAIGSLALDNAIDKGDPVAIALGTKILTMAVLAILITAPIGSIAIAISGPRLLTRQVTLDTAADAPLPVPAPAPGPDPTPDPDPDPIPSPLMETKSDYGRYQQVLQV